MVACGLIIAYPFLVHNIRTLRIREDQIADNCYYLGFLYTLVSLCSALYEYDTTGEIKGIVANFGIALGSTMVGIVLRVFLNQMRRDPLEIDHEARLELAAAAGALREQIEDAALALKSFCQTTEQMAGEQMRSTAARATKVLEEGAARVAQASDAAMRQIEQAGRRLEPALAAADSVASRISDRMRQDEENLRALADRSSALNKEMLASLEAANAAAKGFAGAGRVAEELATAGRKTTAELFSIARTAESALGSQRRVAEALEDASQNLLPTLRDYNEKIEVELNRSKRNAGRTSEVLGELADEIRRELA
ncbi:MAG: hypothetical protein ACR65Z_16260 [Methylocystis sp.]